LRDFLLRGCVLAGAITALLTELLGGFQLLRPVPLAAAWLAIGIGGLLFLYLHPPHFHRFAIKPFEALIAAGIVWIAGLVAVAAWLCPPNSHDVLGYHLPRIVYWAQSGSVGLFPTPYVNQIDLPPLAEYFMLHTYVLSGGDHFVNLVSWASFAASILGVTAIAAALGADSRSQAFAALFCATLPSAILQASSAKNECLAAFWLVSMVYFVVRRDWLFLGFSLGLAVFTKGTAYLFAPPLVAGMFLCDTAGNRWRRWRFVPAWAAFGILLVNAPLYIRNLEVSGSPFGFDSPFANGLYKYRNEPLGWKPTVSNLLLNLSDQLGSSSERWNQGVYRLVMDLHRWLHIDPRDPANALRMSRYAPPVNTRHEANANNRWHLLLLVAAVMFAVWLAWRRHDRRWSIYAASILCGFLLFCFYARWYPWDARYLLGPLVVAAPIAGVFLGSVRPRAAAMAIGLLLFSLARLPATENWLRPLKGPNNVFATSREAQYFADIGGMHNQASYWQSVDLTARSGCRMVGIDSSENQLEYPFQALLLERAPGIRFEHTGVQNPSVRFADPKAPGPCAVLCLDCVENQKKIAMYSPIGPPVVIGRFLLFLPGGSSSRIRSARCAR
jgi:4-amino-4-deoxy-L-arabinose transferase-like glycosyltransferase